MWEKLKLVKVWWKTMKFFVVQIITTSHIRSKPTIDSILPFCCCFYLRPKDATALWLRSSMREEFWLISTRVVKVVYKMYSQFTTIIIFYEAWSKLNHLFLTQFLCRRVGFSQTHSKSELLQKKSSMNLLAKNFAKGFMNFSQREVKRHPVTQVRFGSNILLVAFS